MNVTQLIAQTAITFIAATVGAFLGSFLTRRTERFKHLQELRSAAYIDFVSGVANAAHRTGGIAEVADARCRIAIYGGKGVVRSLSGFIASGAQTRNREGMQAFARRHFPELDPARTEVVCVECVGGPTLTIVEGEGMLRMRDYPLQMRDGLESAARRHSWVSVEREHRNSRPHRRLCSPGHHVPPCLG